MNKRVLKIIGIVCLAAFMLRFLSGMIMGLLRGHPEPTVSVVQVGNDDYTKNIKLSGRVVSVHSADIKARVQGILAQKYFNEGDFVKQGQLLFRIEPTQYSIAVQKASAQVANARASLIELDKNLVRVRQLVSSDFVSRSEYDKALASRDMARANLSAASAQLADARLSLGYTRVVAPVSGRIGNLAVTVGNLVDLSTPSLATVMSMNPIYVTFDISAADYLSLQKTIIGKNVFVDLKLPDGTLYPVKGKLDFYNNKVDESTGTVKLRATFANPSNLLLPGEFVEASISFGESQGVYTLPQNIVLQNSNGKYVYVLDKDNVVQLRPVEVGEALGNKWIVLKGLLPQDRVVADNIQSLRPDMKVKVKE